MIVPPHQEGPYTKRDIESYYNLLHYSTGQSCVYLHIAEYGSLLHYNFLAWPYYLHSFAKIRLFIFGRQRTKVHFLTRHARVTWNFWGNKGPSRHIFPDISQNVDIAHPVVSLHDDLIQGHLQNIKPLTPFNLQPVMVLEYFHISRGHINHPRQNITR